MGKTLTGTLSRDSVKRVGQHDARRLRKGHHHMTANTRLDAYETYTLTDWATAILQWSEDKGWNEQLHPNGDHFDGLLMLMTSELSEALEEWRNGHAVGATRYETDKHGNPKPEGVPIELIDCVIRVLHVLAYYGVDVQQAMITKHEYNLTRPYRHGGKRA